MSGPYDDIMGLPHHVSPKHPQMPRAKRAAQFMPFKALTGYDAAVIETARLTDSRIDLGEEAIDALDEKLHILTARTAEHPSITVTFFRPDERKDGGAYVDITGALKKIDEYERVIVLMSGEKIPSGDVLDIEAAVFAGLL